MDNVKSNTLEHLRVELGSITRALENLTNNRDIGDMSIQSSNLSIMEFFNKNLTVEEIETCKLLLKGIEEYISNFTVKIETHCEMPQLTE